MSDQTTLREREHAAQVAKNAVWAEYIEKEKHSQKISQTFTFNPRTMKLISDKPSKILPTAAATRNNELQAMIHENLHRAYIAPRHKYEFPLLTSHELGWFLQEAQSSHKSQYYNPRQQTDVTKYAERYVISQGYSPFRKIAPTEKDE